jgi:hypothetical protein
MKKIMRPVVSLFVAVVALVGGAGVATADVVVSPGASGNVCSGYAYVTTNPNRYFQTCAWADANYIWFTGNFGNSSAVDWPVDGVTVGYWRSGVYHECFGDVSFLIPANSTRSTSKGSCRIGRARAAVQAYTYVTDAGTANSVVSDTLQVQ